MKKKVFGRKFSRDYNARKAMFRSLLASMAMHDSINTTLAKAKSILPDVDGLVKLARSGDLYAYKRLVAFFGNDEKTAKGLVERVKSFSDGRKSGFTRIVRLPNRLGDRAPMVKMEWVEKPAVQAKAKNEKSKEGSSAVAKKDEVKKVSLRERLTRKKK